MNTTAPIKMEDWPPWAEWKRLYWPVVIGIAVIHIMAVFALFHFTWSGLAICAFLYCVTGCLGITLCYHRLMTHRSLKTPKWCEYGLFILALAALQGGIRWIGNHRLHHKDTEVKDVEPHTTKNGFWWAHIGWNLFKDPEGRDPLEFVKDLRKDPVIVALDRVFWLPQVVLTIVLFCSGVLIFDVNTGVSWVLWGIGMRTMLVYHATWSINSVCHTRGWWGKRKYDTDDDSVDSVLVALITFGEGYHHKHHDDQRAAHVGPFDPTYWVIKIMEFFGLAWGIVEPKTSPV